MELPGLARDAAQISVARAGKNVQSRTCCQECIADLRFVVRDREKAREKKMGKRDKILDAMRVGKSDKVRLKNVDSASTAGIEDKKEARELLAETIRDLTDLQYRLYAEAKKSVLIVLQAMDTGGKDGTIRNVFGPLNPQGVSVASFKRPTPDELAHDYLWRIHHRTPARGEIKIFNRSHYEDVLVPMAHRLLPSGELEKRCRQINDFERHLAENDTVILKFFLHISKQEQKLRLESRLEDAEKRWKFEPGDLAERKFWDQYQNAYETILEKCSAKYAPWYIIPADNKWYRDWAVAEIAKRELKSLQPDFPREKEGLDSVTVE